MGRAVENRDGLGRWFHEERAYAQRGVRAHAATMSQICPERFQ